MQGAGISSYQQYGSTDNFTSVAFHPPTVTDQPNEAMGAPQRYQPIDETEPEFSVNAFNTLNQYLIRRCIPPRRKAKSFIFATKLNILLALSLCACCACPCLYFAHRWAKSVKVLNNQQDYLSARSRSWVVVCCNITGIITAFLGGITFLTIVGLLLTALSKIFITITG